MKKTGLDKARSKANPKAKLGQGKAPGRPAGKPMNPGKRSY